MFFIVQFSQAAIRALTLLLLSLHGIVLYHTIYHWWDLLLHNTSTRRVFSSIHHLLPLNIFLLFIAIFSLFRCSLNSSSCLPSCTFYLSPYCTCVYWKPGCGGRNTLCAFCSFWLPWCAAFVPTTSMSNERTSIIIKQGTKHITVKRFVFCFVFWLILRQICQERLVCFRYWWI